jgi:glucosylceramidase
VIRKILTKKDSDDRLEEKPVLELTKTGASDNIIVIDSNLRYQKILGFGGALTESAAYTLSKVSGELREEVLNAYYAQDDGLGYSLGRIHINSCDFALGNYTYVDDGDTSLESFSINHDYDLIIPLIKDAMDKRGGKLLILASPWSPPAWMKSNADMNHGGKLLPEFKEAWASYFIKFIKEYKKAGIPIWGITVQNEPEAIQVWDSCLYSGEEERDFVKDFLGPALHESGLGQVKLLIHDHNRDIILKRAKKILEDPEASKYIWGTGFHWYVSEDFCNVGRVHDLFPEKHLLFTEGCQEGGVHLGEWHTGERYGRNMIGDLNNWCEGYIDWNIVLDENGGPNHVGNFCDAPIICDTLNDRVHYNSSYYYIGHFSKYIKPGAVRLFSECPYFAMHAVAFENPDGRIAAVIMNEGESGHEISLDTGIGYINDYIDSHSILTYII